AQTICSMPSLVPSSIRCGLPDLDCIVTVVDALRLKDEFGCGQSLTKSNIGEEDLENLVIQQIEFCNIILLNKASEVTPEELERIRQIIRAIQPKAEIIACDFCDVDLDTIINTGMFDFDKVATSAAWITEIEAQPADTYGKHEKESHHPDDHDESDHEHHHHHDHEEDEEEHGHHHHHHHHDEGEAEEYGIGTFVYCRRAPFNLGDFDEFVARKWPKNVIRAKGICYFQNEYDLCYVFEQAGRQFALSNAGRWYATMPKDELERLIEQEPGIARDWDGKYGDRMQKLVFIGQHLDKEAITEALDNCLAE
ncbi:MAG: GTP-binding protein, partial [Bacteroidaceae bacterium]|nr:GTP-binding protein [Bacteroidaceae bacterium]